MRVATSMSILLALISLVKCDYYWKIYKGTIPPDAFIGGHEMDGTPTYIGLTFFQAKSYFLSTIIHKGDSFAYVIVNTKEKWENDKHNLILCSNTPELLKWIPTTTSKVRFLTDCPTIYAGGHNHEEAVGRAFYDGRTITGRFKGENLFVHDFQYQEKSLTEFELLTYICTNPWVENVAEVQ